MQLSMEQLVRAVVGKCETDPECADQEVADLLQRSGCTPEQATEAVAFTALAIGHVLLRRDFGIVPPGSYVRAYPSGRTETLPLSEHPVYVAAAKEADLVLRAGGSDEGLLQAASRSGEFRAAVHILQSGEKPAGTCTLIRAKSDAPVFSKPRRPWWQFW